MAVDSGERGNGERRVISKQLLFVEVEPDGTRRHIHYAPYLDLRALAPDEPTVADLLAHPACTWVARDVERQAMEYAIREVVPAADLVARFKREYAEAKARICTL